MRVIALKTRETTDKNSTENSSNYAGIGAAAYIYIYTERALKPPLKNAPGSRMTIDPGRMRFTKYPRPNSPTTSSRQRSSSLAASPFFRVTYRLKLFSAATYLRSHIYVCVHGPTQISVFFIIGRKKKKKRKICMRIVVFENSCFFFGGLLTCPHRRIGRPWSIEG